MAAAEVMFSLSRSPGEEIGLSSSEEPQKKRSLTGGREVLGGMWSWVEEGGRGGMSQVRGC